MFCFDLNNTTIGGTLSVQQKATEGAAKVEKIGVGASALARLVARAAGFAPPTLPMNPANITIASINAFMNHHPGVKSWAELIPRIGGADEAEAVRMRLVQSGHGERVNDILNTRLIASITNEHQLYLASRGIAAQYTQIVTQQNAAFVATLQQIDDAPTPQVIEELRTQIDQHLVQIAANQAQANHATIDALRHRTEARLLTYQLANGLYQMPMPVAPQAPVYDANEGGLNEDEEEGGPWGDGAGVEAGEQAPQPHAAADQLPPPVPTRGNLALHQQDAEGRNLADLFLDKVDSVNFNLSQQGILARTPLFQTSMKQMEKTLGKIDNNFKSVARPYLLLTNATYALDHPGEFTVGAPMKLYTLIRALLRLSSTIWVKSDARSLINVAEREKISKFLDTEFPVYTGVGNATTMVSLRKWYDVVDKIVQSFAISGNLLYENQEYINLLKTELESRLEEGESEGESEEESEEEPVDTSSSAASSSS